MKKKLKLVLTLGLMVSFFLTLSAQRTISGTVTDAETGEGLIGANILVTGTATGTVTDFNGDYTLELPEGASSLTFSYTGYATIEEPVNGRTTIDIAMSSGEILEEVVVIGYGTVKKEDATGSVQSVGTEQFNRGAITGPQELLAGKIAGVSISTNNGAPGEGAKIRIRGESSITASNDPLIVIDGVPLDSRTIGGGRNPLNIINPNDIESFTVLKDASAAAIYGNRAAGGVILITTKKGSVGQKFRVGYTGNISLGTIASKIDVLDAREFSALIQEQFDEGHPAIGLLGDADTDWQDEIYQNAFGMDHNLHFSGAAGIIPYRVSLGYTDKDGILKTDNFNRLTAGINLNPGFLENRLQINFSLKGMRTQNRFADRGAIGSALSFDPTKPVLNPDSKYAGYWVWEDGNVPNALAPANPVALLELKEDEATINRFITNISADYRFSFLPSLRANLNLAYDKSDSEGMLFFPQEAPFSYNNGDGGEIKNYTAENTNSLLEFYLNYKEDFGKNGLDLMLGYSWQKFFKNNFEESTNVSGSRINNPPNSNPREYFLASVFGRLNYSYDDRYLLTLTLRRDGTSRFSPDNRYGLFPAAALAIKAYSDEEASGFNNLKIRLGWGVTGQQDIGDETRDFYAYLPQYQASLENAQYQLGETYYTTLRPNGYDADIRWEETTTYNLGVDFGFLKNRLSGSIDVYQRNTKDLLNFVPVPAGTNLTNFLTTNVGDLENQGIELAINGTPIQQGDMTLDLGFNIAYNRNEITRLTATDDPNYQGVLTGGISGGVGSNIQIHSVGFPASSFYVFEQVYDEQGVPIEGLYVDRNQDGVINADDQYRYQQPAADYTLGFTGRFAYKNMDVSFGGRSNIGNFVYNNVWSNQAFYNTLYNSTQVISNVHAQTSAIDFTNPRYFTDFFVRDASFLRVDHITVGYNFDNLLGEFMRIYGTVQNPIVLSNYEGIDPEVTNGIDNNVYPRPLTFVLGFSVDF